MKIEKNKGLGPSVYKVPDLRKSIPGTYNNKEEKQLLEHHATLKIKGRYNKGFRKRKRVMMLAK